MSSNTTVVVVWDGFRSQDMCWELTPNLMKLGNRGTIFRESRCAYPSLTRVNCASLVTGSWASTHGLAGNTLYVPEIDPSGPSSLASEEVIGALAGLRGGRLCGDSPTLGDVLADNGKTLFVTSAASPGSSTILGWGSSALIGDGLPVPSELKDGVSRFGTCPGRNSPDPTALNRYIARVAAEFVIPQCHPDVLLVWLCEPDASQHKVGLADARVRDAIKANDEMLGSIISAVGQDGHVVVTSDHGHTEADVQQARTSDLLDQATGLQSGVDYVMTSDGIYLLIPTSQEVVGQVISGLRSIHTIGSIFTKLTHPDAMPMADVQLGGPWAPDIKYSHHAGPCEEGARRTVRVGAECDYRSTHGSIGPSDMRNVLVAGGPAFRRGVRSEIPCGIVDIAPTILSMLSIPVPSNWDGRPLHEALAGGSCDRTAVIDSSTQGTWHFQNQLLTQSVQRASVNDTTYVLSGSTARESSRLDAART